VVFENAAAFEKGVGKECPMEREKGRRDKTTFSAVDVSRRENRRKGHQPARWFWPLRLCTPPPRNASRPLIPPAGSLLAPGRVAVPCPPVQDRKAARLLVLRSVESVRTSACRPVSSCLSEAGGDFGFERFLPRYQQTRAGREGS